MNIKLILFIILVAAVVLLVAILFFQRKRKRKIHRSAYIDALYALIDGRRNDALRLLTRAVKNGEGDVDAYLQLGNLLRENNQPEKALQIHRSLTVRRELGYEEEKAIQLAIAEDLASLGKKEKAIQVLEAMQSRRTDVEVVLKLHTLYHRNGNYERAYTMLRDLSRLDPHVNAAERASYLATVANTFRREGRKDEAKKFLERARKEDANSTPALYISGLLAMEEKDLNAATAMWEQLLHTDIDYFSEVVPLLEKVLYESGRFRDLERILGELLQKYPGKSPLVVALSFFYEKKGELEKAIGILEDGLAAGRADSNVYGKLALLYLLEGRGEDAEHALRKIDVGTMKTLTFTCKQCNNSTDVPLAYCDRCSGFKTFTREYETIHN